MSTHNATLSSGCSKASWRVTANSPHWGLNPGPSVYKTDALPLSYRGFRFDDKLVRPTIYFGPAEMPIARRTHSPPRSPESQGMQEALNPGNSLESSTLKRKRHTRSNTSKHTHTHTHTYARKHTLPNQNVDPWTTPPGKWSNHRLVLRGEAGLSLEQPK